MRNKFSILLLIALLMLTLAGCGGGGAGSGATGNRGYVSVRVSYPQDYSPAGRSEESVDYVSYYTIDIYEYQNLEEETNFEELVPVVPTTRVDYPNDTAVILQVPIGEKTLVIYGYDEDQQRVLYSISTITVELGENAPVTVNLDHYGPVPPPPPPPPVSPPVINSITPANAPAGTVVSIIGEHFGDTQERVLSTVDFAGVPSQNYTLWSDTEIRCVVPVCPNGPVTVTVGGIASNQVQFVRDKDWNLVGQFLSPAGETIDLNIGIQMDIDPSNNITCAYSIMEIIYANRMQDGTWGASVLVHQFPAAIVLDKLGVVSAPNGSAYAYAIWFNDAWGIVYNPNTGTWDTWLDAAYKLSEIPFVTSLGFGVNSNSKPFAGYITGAGNYYYSTASPLLEDWVVDIPVSTGDMSADGHLLVGPDNQVHFIYNLNTEITVVTRQTDGTLGPQRTYTLADAFEYFPVIGADGVITIIYNITPSGIGAIRYNPATNTWSAPVSLDGNFDTTDIKWAATDPQGNVMVAYTVNFHQNLFARFYDVSTATWQPRVQLDNAAIDSIYSVHLAFDREGNALVVFDGFTSPDFGVYATRYEITRGTFGAPVSILPDAGTSGSSPKVVFDSRQNAHVVMELYDGNSRAYYVKYE